jgi:tetratricopeptide (TPR) repeat protein
MNRLCASYDALGYIAYHVGDLITARAHLEKSLDLYDTIPRPPGTSLVPFDIGVSAQAGLALTLCVIGEGRQALHHGRQAVERARKLVPQVGAFSLAYAHTGLSRVHLLRREPEPAAEHARQAVEIGRAHGYATPMLEGQLGLALARVAAGEAAAGAAQLARAVEAWGAGGYELDLPYWLAGLAECHRDLGELDTAEATLETAIVHMDRQRGHVWAAELYRLRAELMLLRSPSQADRAAAELEHALGVARAQGARLFELRAATSLHRLRRGQGRAGESRAVLAMVLRGVQPETDPIAVQEAAALLADAS